MVSILWKSCVSCKSSRFSESEVPQKLGIKLILLKTRKNSHERHPRLQLLKYLLLHLGIKSWTERIYNFLILNKQVKSILDFNAFELKFARTFSIWTLIFPMKLCNWRKYVCIQFLDPSTIGILLLECFNIVIWFPWRTILDTLKNLTIWNGE